MTSDDLEISLDAVIVAVTDDTPLLLTFTGPGGLPALPSGPLEAEDATLERGVRRWVSAQTGLELGHVEQLYTFGDRVRGASPVEQLGRLLSVAYLALVREVPPTDRAAWIDFYDVFPWEDHRAGRPAVIEDHIVPALQDWAGRDVERTERIQILFGLDGAAFDGVRTLERYELCFEAGLMAESTTQLDSTALRSRDLHLDHRRIAATALGRLRGKLGYRPVVFELLPSEFTLLQLQRVVEALAGVSVHKQNFRRLVETGGLVEGTGRRASSGGRPAELFRFRHEVLRERPRPGLGTPWVRS